MNNQIQMTQDQIAGYKLERQLKSSASWFYWIAGLSVINWIASAFNIGYSFVIGLGVTQLFDGITDALIQDMGSSYAMFFSIISMLAMLAFSGAYAVLGYFASKRGSWAFIVGSIIYILDAGIFIWVGDYLALIFHAWALFGLLRGPAVIKKLKLLEESQPAISNFQSL